MHYPSSAENSIHTPGLALYAKFGVFCLFVLIYAGALVTTSGSGMAVPDWPLSFGTLNPHGWWGDLPVRMEHGHRLIASGVGMLTMLLCAWVWRHRGLMITAGLLPLALALSILAGPHHEARSPEGSLHASLWFAGIMLVLLGIFSAVLFSTTKHAPPGGRTVRWLAFIAFVAVCLQAILGGLRVTQQTAGAMDLALALRIFHGCVAQAFLCLVVATACLLSPRWPQPWPTLPNPPKILAWITVCAIYLQLILGASMRHLGAGLAITTFPAANPDGGLMPAVHSAATDLNFGHTRIGPVIISLLIFVLAFRVIRSAQGERRLLRPAFGLIGLVIVQISLGIVVIWHAKPLTLTTLHVLNGALLLATTLLLAMRLTRAAKSAAAGAHPGGTGTVATDQPFLAPNEIPL